MNQTNYPMFDKLRFLYNLLIIYMTLIFLSSFLLKFQFCTCFSYIFLFTLPLIFYKKVDKKVLDKPLLCVIIEWFV